MKCVVAKSHNAVTPQLLSQGLGGVVITPRSSIMFNPGDVVINWGRVSTPRWINSITAHGKYYNPYNLLPRAANKVLFFKHLQSIYNSLTDHHPLKFWVGNSPEITEEIDHFLSNKPVMLRKLITGHSGLGAVYVGVDEHDKLLPVPLVTEYFAKKWEYRVHVWGDNIIDVVQKRASNNVESNVKIRNYANGWVFAHELSHPLPVPVKEGVLKIHKHFELDFAGYDILLKSSGSWVCCEINTAPALTSPTSRNAYLETINEL